jgi:ribosomal protein S15P/S13E
MTNKLEKIDSPSYKLGVLTQSIEDLKIHFNNHLHNHLVDRILNIVLFLATVVMFTLLKYSK